MLKHVLYRNRAPIGYKALTQRFAVVKEVRADHGAQSIGPDQSVTYIGCSIGTPDPCPITQILEGDNLPVGFQSDGLVSVASIRKDSEQIVTVHHNIGIAESVEKWRAQVRRCQCLTRERI
jgi:hypothetical protein